MGACDAVVCVDNLVKRYGDLVAVDHLSLSIARGEVFGLLGPNGSGKTTTINCVLQLLSYDHGDVQLFGEPMRPTSYQLKRRVGVVPQEVAVFEELTVRENVDSFCALYVSDRARRRELVDAGAKSPASADFDPAQALRRDEFDACSLQLNRLQAEYRRASAALQAMVSVHLLESEESMLASLERDCAALPCPDEAERRQLRLELRAEALDRRAAAMADLRKTDAPEPVRNVVLPPRFSPARAFEEIFE